MIDIRYDNHKNIQETNNLMIYFAIFMRLLYLELDIHMRRSEQLIF